LRGWKPVEKPPSKGWKKLSPPHFEFIELETARAFGYTLSQWRAEHPDRRARLIAHELEKSLRESYQSEMLGESNNKKVPDNPFERQKAQWGLQ